MQTDVILAKFEELARKYAHVKHFDEPANCFVLRPPLNDFEIAEFESEFKITLPDAYRNFLTKVGNGSLGPSYEIYPLGWIEGRRWDSNEVHPKGPFQHKDAWNLDEQTLESFEEAKGSENEQRSFELYWKPEITRGSVPISDLGCGSQLLLVLDGPQVGFVWKDCRADHFGLRPLLDESGAPMTFQMWLLDLLENSDRVPSSPESKSKDQRQWVDWLVLVLVALSMLAFWYWIRYQR